jgi:hypothetical protein
VDLATFEQLLSPTGAACLSAAVELSPTHEAFLGCYEKLRKRWPSELVKAAVETCVLRRKAAAKFSHAAEMYFTREALEQATSESVARHRAERFRGMAHVADLCCGIGADAIALASVGCRVTAIDRDPLRVRMAEANVITCGVGERVTCQVADVLTDMLPAVDAVFLDPARRADGKRFLSLADYLPPPMDVLGRLPKGLPAAVKVAPAVAWDELDRLDCEIEFVSLEGELKECVLWFNGFRTHRRRATALPAGAMMFADAPLESPSVSDVKAYLYDLDPAVTRSGLVPNLAVELVARPIDANLGFLTADHLTPTPFAAVYAVEAVLPFHAKRVGEWLKGAGIGRVTVVKRGSSVDADELVKKWKLSGSEHRAVILTRACGEAVAIIARRVAEPIS